MIDPITALEGLQTAISVVKKASKVASDLAGLTDIKNTDQSSRHVCL